MFAAVASMFAAFFWIPWYPAWGIIVGPSISRDFQDQVREHVQPGNCAPSMIVEQMRAGEALDVRLVSARLRAWFP